jgi:hypothetical protein
MNLLVQREVVLAVVLQPSQQDSAMRKRFKLMCYLSNTHLAKAHWQPTLAGRYACQRHIVTLWDLSPRTVLSAGAVINELVTHMLIKPQVGADFICR